MLPPQPREPQCHTGPGDNTTCPRVTIAPWQRGAPVSQCPVVTQPRAVPPCWRWQDRAQGGLCVPLGDIYPDGDPSASHGSSQGCWSIPVPSPSSREGPRCPQISALLCWAAHEVALSARQ